MVVVMTRQRAWQHAGREQALSIGQAYELPETVACALVASGAAERVVTATDLAPENAMAAPAETGRVRRRGAA